MSPHAESSDKHSPKATAHRKARGADDSPPFSGYWRRAGVRSGTAFIIFTVVALTTGLLGSWIFAPAVGWIVAAGFLSIWIWMADITLGPKDTARHATRDDPTQPVSQSLLILASIASVGAVVLLLLESGSVEGAARFGLAATALATVAASWATVQILFTLRYAGLYYGAGGTGIDFNQTAPPEYRDFAYLAFTIGMTYQVSDTSLTSAPLRREALRHAVLSFVLGGIVVAATVNLLVGLAG
ncbi:DUF1345 domain-containing protein [Microbacterium sp. P04]|uniref:DUF1345 domain-containing protein n=1 Tax=Microbacterium sp. P04 TaxID=3366947 RepID=UPI00374649FD